MASALRGIAYVCQEPLNGADFSLGEVAQQVQGLRDQRAEVPLSQGNGLLTGLQTHSATVVDVR